MPQLYIFKCLGPVFKMNLKNNSRCNSMLSGWSYIYVLLLDSFDQTEEWPVMHHQRFWLLCYWSGSPYCTWKIWVWVVPQSVSRWRWDVDSQRAHQRLHGQRQHQARVGHFLHRLLDVFILGSLLEVFWLRDFVNNTPDFLSFSWWWSVNLIETEALFVYLFVNLYITRYMP